MEDSGVLAFLSKWPHSTSIAGPKHALPRVIRGVTRRLPLDGEAHILAELSACRSNDLPIPDDFEERAAEAAAGEEIRMLDEEPFGRVVPPEGEGAHSARPCSGGRA